MTGLFMQLLCCPTLPEPETKVLQQEYKCNANNTFDFKTIGWDTYAVVSDLWKYVISH